MANRVAVIGGGLAGLAAAQKLAERDFHIVVLESRQRLGGRAGSFVDANTGQTIDACQHVSMRCCKSLAHFFRTVGVDHLLKPQRELYFQTPDGRISHFRGDPLPAPLHLARSFLGLHFLTLGEKLRIAWGLARLRFARTDQDERFIEWLKGHRQTQRCIDRFWSVVLVSALNESIDRVGLKYAHKVFVDAFLRDRRGFEMEVPTVPLDRLYGEEMQQWFKSHNVDIRLNAAVKTVDVDGSRVGGLLLRDGQLVEADWYVSAVPFDRLLSLLPGKNSDGDPALSRLRQLETSPIVSVHLWFDRPVMQLPHTVLVDCLSQWLFNRGEIAASEWYVQVVISAAREAVSWGNDQIEKRVIDEISRVLPESTHAKLLRSRLVVEHAATISVTPGVDQLRPGPRCSIENLILAGDWTNTDWPGTMESAVISGYRAADAIMAAVEG